MRDRVTSCRPPPPCPILWVAGSYHNLAIQRDDMATQDFSEPASHGISHERRECHDIKYIIYIYICHCAVFLSSTHMALPCCVAFVVAVADHHLPTSAPGSRPTLSSTRSCIRLGAVLPRAIHRPLGVGRTWSKWCIPKSSGAWIPNIFQMDPNGCPRVPGSWFLSHAHFYSRTINLSRAVLPDSTVFDLGVFLPVGFQPLRMSRCFNPE